MKVFVTQWCLTLCHLMDCSPSGSSVHGILQARILEWVAIPFSRGSSWPRDQSWVSCIASIFFTIWAKQLGLLLYISTFRRIYRGASLVTQMVKTLPALQETWVWFLGWEDPLEKGMATHSSILAWRIPWTEETGGLQSKGSQRVYRGHKLYPLGKI